MTPETTPPAVWPVLTRYDADYLARIALPLGGIGTGTVSLGGRGDLRDWEVVNRPAKGFTPGRTFFALRAEPEGGPAVTRVLEGPVDLSLYEGGFGARASNHGLPRFRQAAFEGAYPFGQVVLSDPGVPVSVRLQAFNPLVPGDAERSGLPVAVLRWVLTNQTDAPVSASVCGSLENFVGADGTTTLPGRKNANEFRAMNNGKGELAGVFLHSHGVDPQAETWGTLALAAIGVPAANISHRTAWAELSWGDALLDFWDDFAGDGRLDERPAGKTDTPTASLAASVVLAPRATETVTFVLAWHFPNRLTWSPDPPAENGANASSSGDACGCANGDCAAGGANPNWIGNYYTTRFRDAWDAAGHVAANLPGLEADTLAFVNAFCAADLPAVVKEAALYNVSTLRTQTCFRTPGDGFLFGWEGCGDKAGCCEGTCTHVWNYENALAFLFPDLARGQREVEFGHATDPDIGRMSFRVHLPLGRKAREWPTAAADGQMGCLMRLYREWRASGDDDWLRRLWPQARKTLEFCWIPGGWDADRDGVMEGCQHNTMDVEYYGPNPQMGAWYLGALRACEEMARHLGEADFARECRRLFDSGSAWLDAHLFNGEYYEHQVWPPNDTSAIASGLRHESMGARDLSDPELQLGAGCLVDQLVGQYMAHVCGLGYLLRPENVRATLASIAKYNGRPNLWGHFNHLRTFALGEESALLMASYPRGRRPARPFPYHNEVMTGFEYTAAVGMLQEGLMDEGIGVIAAIRARYDGRKRSPFDEAECGHHYARAMASWAAVLALTGFGYDGVTQTLRFAAVAGSSTPTTWFWSTGVAWGTVTQMLGASGGGVALTLTVLYGRLLLRRLELTGVGEAAVPRPEMGAGETVTVTVGEASPGLPA